MLVIVHLLCSGVHFLGVGCALDAAVGAVQDLGQFSHFDPCLGWWCVPNGFACHLCGLLLQAQLVVLITILSTVVSQISVFHGHAHVFGHSSRGSFGLSHCWRFQSMTCFILIGFSCDGAVASVVFSLSF